MTTLSAFLEAIDYAVNVNHVNVLNEEAGCFPFPDDTSPGPDQGGQRRGHGGRGDASPSPSYDAGPAEHDLVAVLAARRDQRRRLHQPSAATPRTTPASTTRCTPDGWVSDNISSLSSGGATEEGGSIDVVAPGDLRLGGLPAVTSLPAVATIMVQSGDERGGAPHGRGRRAGDPGLPQHPSRRGSPSVSLVRDIISSSADDLGMPGSEQGSGLVDAYRAVKAAMAAAAARGRRRPGAGGQHPAARRHRQRRAPRPRCRSSSPTTAASPRPWSAWPPARRARPRPS